MDTIKARNIVIELAKTQATTNEHFQAINRINQVIDEWILKAYHEKPVWNISDEEGRKECQ